MNKTFLFLLFLCSLSSCKVVNTLTIDYLQPAHVTFPPEVKSVIVVNNALKAEQEDLNRLYNVEADGKSVNTLATTELGYFDCNREITTEILAQHIAEGQYFDEVLICDSALRSDDQLLRETKLTQEEVKELVNEFNVDMILAVEDSKVYIERKPYFDFNYPGTLFVFDAIVSSRVRVYLPNRSEPMLTISPKDSIFWIEGSRNIKEQMIQEASELAGTLPVKYLIPTWETTERAYYASGCMELRDAAVWVKEDKLGEALKLWLQTYEKKSNNLKMRSAFNIALYYEIQDNLEEAKVWLLKAYELSESKQKMDKSGIALNPSEDDLLINLYMVKLEERLNNHRKLELQMGRLKNNF